MNVHSSARKHGILAEDAIHAANNPLLMLSGAGWYLFMELIPNHPFVQRVLVERDAVHLRALVDVLQTMMLMERVVEEARAAQARGVIRSDVKVELIIESTRPILLQVMMPLLAEGK